MGKGKAKKDHYEVKVTKVEVSELDPEPEMDDEPPIVLFPRHVTVRYVCDCGVVEVVKLPRFGNALVRYPVMCFKCNGTMHAPALP